MTAAKDPTVSDSNPVEPDHLLSGFSRSGLAAFLVLSLVCHTVFIGGLSIGYIKDTWIDPDGAKLRKQQERAELDRQKAEQMAKEAAAKAPPKPAKTTEAAPAKPADGKPADAKPADAKSADGVPDAVKASETYQKATELPKPGETPGAPAEQEILKSIDNLR